LQDADIKAPRRIPLAAMALRIGLLCPEVYWWGNVNVKKQTQDDYLSGSERKIQVQSNGTVDHLSAKS
jgi:hypothetical protein